MKIWIRKETRVLVFRVTKGFQYDGNVPAWVAKLMYDRKLNVSTDKNFPGFEFKDSTGRARIYKYGDYVVNSFGEIEVVDWLKFKNGYRCEEIVSVKEVST